MDSSVYYFRLRPARFEKIGLQYGSQKVFLTSSEKGTGMEELKQYLESVLERSQEQQE